MMPWTDELDGVAPALPRMRLKAGSVTHTCEFKIDGYLGVALTHQNGTFRTRGHRARRRHHGVRTCRSTSVPSGDVPMHLSESALAHSWR